VELHLGYSSSLCCCFSSELGFVLFCVDVNDLQLSFVFLGLLLIEIDGGDDVVVVDDVCCL